LIRFGIEFEPWYQHGYWTEKYQPYSFIVNEKVVANVSVNLVKLVVNKQVMEAIQIGTVMTHPEYRHRGLSKRLMNIVLEEYKHIGLFYLFANETVLDFYPKFGFSRYKEVQFSLEYLPKEINRGNLKKLDVKSPKDLAFIYDFASARVLPSSYFGTLETEELFMFYCLMVFSEDLYYLEEEEALVIYQMENNVLHLYDVISKKKVELICILKKISNETVNKVIFHYHPDTKEVALEHKFYQSNLFVKFVDDIILPEKFKHPITAQA
jgi:predicted acetyltransferase